MKKQKQTKLERIREEVDHITDRIGQPVDQGIKDAVAAFMFAGLPTTASCEGHKNRGMAAPWIDIGFDEPDKKNWFNDKKLRQQMDRKLAKLQNKMIELFVQFYRNRKVPYDAMLGIEGVGWHLRVQSQAQICLDIASQKRNYPKVTRYRKEMNDFAKFLITKFSQ